VPGSTACIPANIYVSALTGSDDNSGTSLKQPLKTFDKAMRTAEPGQTVVFGLGTYGSDDGGIDFSESIPDGVHLTRTEEVGEVKFQSNGSASLEFAGSGSLISSPGVAIYLSGFQHALRATTGSQEIRNVNIQDSKGAVLVAGDATMRLQDVKVEGAPTHTALVGPSFADGEVGAVWVRERAIVRWVGGSLIGTYGSAQCSSAVGVYASQESSLALSGVHVRGQFATSVFFSTTNGALNVDFSVFESGCDEENLQTYSLVAQSAILPKTDSGPNADFTVDLARSTFSQSVEVLPSKNFKARHCTFSGDVGVSLPVYEIAGPTRTSDDLGTPSDPGNNIFQGARQTAGLSTMGLGNIIWAVGNQWAPNTQGTNGDGHFPAGTVIRGNVSERNVRSLGDNEIHL
jgi:hypothetical protein